MKTKITAIVTVLILACFAFAIVSKSSPVQSGQPPQQPVGAIIGEEPLPEPPKAEPLLVIQKSSQKSLEVGKIYTKAQVIAQFGIPDRCDEWDTDGGIGFECVYGNNFFNFNPERGFGGFGFQNNDFIMNNPKILIGEEYDNFIATHNFAIEKRPLSDSDMRWLAVWPWGAVDVYLHLYFKKSSDGKFKLYRIVYFEPV